MNAEPEEPMDLHLLNLERELFSLSPAEAPKRLTVRLDRQICGPVCLSSVGLNTDSSRAVPFRWRRIAVPAAAAVAVVSVLNHIDHSRPALSGFAQTGPGSRAPGTLRVPASQSTGYVLKTEPVYVDPVGWEAAPSHFYINGENENGISLSQPRRQGALEQVVFH